MVAKGKVVGGGGFLGLKVSISFGRVDRFLESKETNYS